MRIISAPVLSSARRSLRSAIPGLLLSARWSGAASCVNPGNAPIAVSGCVAWSGHSDGCDSAWSLASRSSTLADAGCDTTHNDSEMGAADDGEWNSERNARRNGAGDSRSDSTRTGRDDNAAADDDAAEEAEAAAADAMLALQGERREECGMSATSEQRRWAPLLSSAALRSALAVSPLPHRSALCCRPCSLRSAGQTQSRFHSRRPQTAPPRLLRASLCDPSAAAAARLSLHSAAKHASQPHENRNSVGKYRYRTGARVGSPGTLPHHLQRVGKSRPRSGSGDPRRRADCYLTMRERCGPQESRGTIGVCACSDHCAFGLRNSSDEANAFACGVDSDAC